MRISVLFIALPLAGCGAAAPSEPPSPAERADTAAQAICRGIPGELSRSAMRACVEENREMFLEYTEDLQ